MGAGPAPSLVSWVSLTSAAMMTMLLFCLRSKRAPESGSARPLLRPRKAASGTSSAATWLCAVCMLRRAVLQR